MDVDFAPPLDYVEPQKPTPQQQGTFTDNTKKKGDPFSGEGMRIDEKKGSNLRKGSTNVPGSEEEEYDPRKHRIHRGVRKTSYDWQGNGVKIGVPLGTRGKR